MQGVVVVVVMMVVVAAVVVVVAVFVFIHSFVRVCDVIRVV